MILVVDDNEINRLVAVESLAELGYRSETASNGLEAVEKVASGRFAAVLMDCQMPILDGYESAARIRTLDGPAAKTPVIALTAHALPNERAKVLQAGMDDYATKPVRTKVLARVLDRWAPSGVGPRDAASRIEPQRTAPKHDVPQTVAAVTASDAQADAASLPVLDPHDTPSLTAVALFVATMEQEATLLLSLAEDGGSEAVRRQAHKMKGACLSLGALRAAHLCGQLEARARAGQVHADLLASIVPAVAEATSALRALKQAAEG